MSGEAEADFEKGYRVNLDGTRSCSRRSARGQKAPCKPKLVFTSSIAVFGAPLPNGHRRHAHHHTPLTSYGTQKAIGELLLADYSRRGFFDGIGIPPADSL